MARKNLVNQACANRAEVFKRFRDFVCARNGSYDYSAGGIGWTLHDSSYAVDQNTISTNDWFVIKSTGENGKEDLYFRCTYIANYIKIEGFLYWNNSTHAGVGQYNTTSNWYIIDAAVPVLWIYGNLNSIFAIARESSASSSFYPATFGKLANTLYDDTPVTCTTSLTAGSARTIEFGVAVPSTWKVGQKLYLRSNTSVEMITVISISSTSITANLAGSHASGAKVSADLGYYVLGSNNLLGNYPVVLMNRAGTTPSNTYPFLTGPLVSYGYPETLNGDHLLSPVMLAYTGGQWYGEIDGVYGRYSTGMTALEVYQSRDGNNYRAFTVNSGGYIAILEV